MLVFLRVRLVVMSAFLCGAPLLLLQEAEAFYLPGLAPVSFCGTPQDGKDQQRECQVIHNDSFQLLGYNVLIRNEIAYIYLRFILLAS